MNPVPVLYSLHNCPYAIRARMAIYRSRQQVLIRPVKLNNKPEEMLHASPKGSVPVLVVQKSGAHRSSMIIEESLEVMLWALSENDPENLLHSEDEQALPAMIAFISDFEQDFIPALNAYGSAKRYHDDNLNTLRRTCELHLDMLEKRLALHRYLISDEESLADIAVMPFLRKFARIEKRWFRESPYPNLRDWLNGYLQSHMFSKVMEAQELWLENRRDVFFGHRGAERG